MDKEKYKLEYYVINSNVNTDEIYRFNIFNNFEVRNDTVRLLDLLFSRKLTYADFVKDLDGIIRWQEWSRAEYEIVVSSLFSNKDEKKVDCYVQANMNACAVAEHVVLSNISRRKYKNEIIDEMIVYNRGNKSNLPNTDWLWH